MNCPSCNSDWVTTALQGGKVVTKCGACGCLLPRAPAADGGSGNATHAHDDKAKLPASTKAPKRSGAAQQPDAPIDPVPAMKARLRWLGAEIKRLRKLEAEHARLSRILSAASGKPVAVVRELPKRSHG